MVHGGSCHIQDKYVQILAHNGGMKLDRRAVERVTWSQIKLQQPLNLDLNPNEIQVNKLGVFTF